MTFGSARGWHKWVSIALVIPMLIVGATAVFIAHGKSLGTEKIAVSQSFSGNAMKMEMTIVRDMAKIGDVTLAATQAGLFESTAQDFALVGELPAEDYRSLAATPSGEVMAAGKGGLWKRSARGEWTRLREGDFHSVSMIGDQAIAYAKDEGMLASTDGGMNWTAATAFDGLAKAAAKAPETYTLNKLIMDLHTGKFFFGKQAEWVWIDVLGITLVLLCLTGGWIWWRSQRQKQPSA